MLVSLRTLIASRLAFALAVAPLACGPGPSEPQPEDTEGTTAASETGVGSSSTAPAGVDDGSTTTADPTTTDAPVEPDDSSTTAVADGTASDEAGFIPLPDAGSGIDKLPNGEGCESADECKSGSCFVFPGASFGLCSDCSEDADCMIENGPGTCSLTGGQGYAVCTEGEAGTMCQSTAGCQPDLVCAASFEGNPFMFCGECATSDECPEGMSCAPTFEVGNTCLLPGDAELGEACSPNAPEVCATGHCTQALYMEFESGLWLCGECSSDTDCPEGTTCIAASVTMTDFAPSVCG